MKNVVIIGTGGHAKVVTDIIERCGDTVVGYLTSDTSLLSFLGKPVLGAEKDHAKYSEHHFIIAIGDQHARERIAADMPNAKWYTAIHPRAVVSNIGVTIGEGTVVCANAVVSPCALVGKHCIINTCAVVEHDNVIGDFVHVSVGTALAGHVAIGSRSVIGIGACVKNDISICADCIIGAGAAVVKNITERGTYVGVPARKL